MWWIIGVGVIVALLAVGVAGWLLAPTMRTFRGPSFEPTRKDDASVLRAQQSGMVDGGQ
jgi:hypothetical protein